MAELFLAFSKDMWSIGGEDSPDPVALAPSWLAPTWTWGIALPVPSTYNTMTYAKTSLGSVTALGDGYVFSGIVEYMTLDPGGTGVVVPIGTTNPNGLFFDGVSDMAWDFYMSDVTFGWGVGSSGGWVDGIFTASVINEIWFVEYAPTPNLEGS
jgi:hypothetical protein